MAARRFQVSTVVDTALARDRMVNVLYFEDIGTSDQDGLCSDLADIYSNLLWGGQNPEVSVKSYDVGAAPNFPVGESTKNVGTIVHTACPREVALCLSFYAEQNIPRKRGRIYVPAGALGGSVALRPTTAQMNILLAMGQAFADLGGPDVSWNVHSQRSGEDHEVSNIWVDDEWDTQRRRGFRATTRLTAATGS
jgi:hypothetical protein